MSLPEVVAKWQAQGPVVWAEANWILPDGRLVKLAPWQRAILSAYWQRRESVSTLAISNVKKTGKTFVTAILTAFRWLAYPGDHFAVGNDLDQSAARQFGEVREMILRHPALSDLVKVGKLELVFTPTGSRLVALAADASGNAGANQLTSSHTEAWGIVHEAGVRAWDEMTPPPGRFYGLPALRIADSYAGFEGESKTWHDLVDRGANSERVSEEWPIYQEGGLLLFHATGQEARERCYRGSQEEAEGYYKEQAASLRPNTFTRMHGNERTTGEGAFLPPGAWDECFSQDVKPVMLKDKQRLVLGADASTSRDLTALVGTFYNAETETVDVALVRTWKPARGLFRAGKPTVDLEATIGAEVLELHKAGLIDCVYADPYQLHSLILTWEKAGVRVKELAQNAGRVESDQSLYDAVISKSIRHYNDPTLNEHVKNAVAAETVRGFRLAKEKTSKKIDAAVALSMSHYGARESDRNAGGAELIPLDLWDLAEGGESAQKIGDRWYNTTGWYTGPHREGVTWHNCRRRNDGCLACVEEQNADGSLARLKAAEAELRNNAVHDPDRDFSVLLDTEAGQRLISRYQTAQEAAGDEQNTIKLFYKAVARRSRS